MEDRQGQQLGNYKLLHLVGQGGFADVYLGEHIHLRTQAAIKVLQVRLGDNNRQSFLNEARTIAHLIHPYIVRVLDFGVQDNTPFLVMDYAPNGTFRQRFLQGTPLPAAPLVPYIKQTAAALQYGHDKKLIHRDVKPENMLLGANDEVLLGDFGLALIAYNSISRSLTETGGTAVYMAPEQLQGKPRAASDQYALGMIAYEWLTGSCPFQGSFFEIASQQVLSQPASIQEKAPDVSAEIEKVVMRALEKDPQQRFPNVREFALALEDACLPDKHYSLNLPLTQNISTNVHKNTSENASLNPNLAATNYNILSSTSLQNPVKPALITDESVLADRPSDEATSRRYNKLSEKGPYPEEFVTPDNLQLLVGQEQFPSAQNSFSNTNQVQPAQMNAMAGQPVLPNKPSARPNTEQHSRHNNASFPPLSLSPSPTHGELSSTQTGNGPFLDFPPLSPSHLPDSIDGAWSGIPQMSANTFTPAKNTYPGNSQTFQRNTLNHLKAVAAPIYKDSQFQTANVVIIMFVIFVIVASGVGIFAFSNNQRAVQQQNITATSVASKANTAKAIQATHNVQATQTAVVGTDPYLASNGGVLALNDPLTSNQNDWQVGPDATGYTAGKCAITPQGYEVDAPSVAPTPCFQTTQTFTNFAYQIDLTFTAVGQSYSGAGIIFRSGSNLKQYYYFELFASGYYTLQKCTKINCVNYMDGYRLGKTRASTFQTGTNITNTLAVVANGDTIDLFVNKQKISEVTDQISTPYTTGFIGVLATAGNDLGVDTAANTATTAIFSNAKVWKL